MTFGHVQRAEASFQAAARRELPGKSGLVEPKAKQKVHLILGIYKYSGRVWRYDGFTLPEEAALRMKRVISAKEKGERELRRICEKEFPELLRLGDVDGARYEEYSRLEHSLLGEARRESMLISSQYREEIKSFYFAAPAGAYGKHDMIPVGEVEVVHLPELVKFEEIKFRG